ncbi:hypothetical protein QQ045_019929 [Rhodiola kirilowii]
MADVIFFCYKFLDPSRLCLLFVSFWYIWFVRNRVSHGGLWETPISAAARIKILVSQFRSHTKDLSLLPFVDDFDWHPPPPGTVKINIDGSWNFDSKVGGVAAVARDHSGLFMCVRMNYFTSLRSASECEGLTLWEGFALAHDMQLPKVIIETDCLDVFKTLHYGSHFLEPHTRWYFKCVRRLHLIHNNVVLIRREANGVADHFAKEARFHKWRWTKLDCCPCTDIPFQLL